MIRSDSPLPSAQGVFDTIAAVSTGNVLAAIGILRMSGPDTLAVLDRVFVPTFGAPMSEQPDRKLVYGRLLDAEGETLDLCLATVSRGPASYTGEDTAELQCHGSPTVLREGLRSLFAAGARQAKAGEFTRRAFLNGRMDLVQAEAVIDLIDAETPEAARTAAAQLDGAVSERTNAVYDSLTAICSHYHAVLDYPDEDIEDFELAHYRETMREAEASLETLLATYRRGSFVKNGVPAAIIGRANVGKSSLLNALLGYERAIVTDIAGTTRDTLEEKAVLGGVLLRLTDTAGQRQTDDPVERIGVERAQDAARAAELVIAVLDASEPLTDEDEAVLAQARAAEKSLVLLNKSDLPAAFTLDGALCVSARDKTGLSELERRVAALFPPEQGIRAGEVLTSARQADAVRRALEALRLSMSAMDEGFAPDAVLTELEEALSALGELSGRTVREDITNGIFSRFCVGK